MFIKGLHEWRVSMYMLKISTGYVVEDIFTAMEEERTDYSLIELDAIIVEVVENRFQDRRCLWYISVREMYMVYEDDNIDMAANRRRGRKEIQKEKILSNMRFHGRLFCPKNGEKKYDVGARGKSCGRSTNVLQEDGARMSKRWSLLPATICVQELVVLHGQPSSPCRQTNACQSDDEAAGRGQRWNMPDVAAEVLYRRGMLYGAFSRYCCWMFDVVYGKSLCKGTLPRAHAAHAYSCAARL